MIPLGYQVLVDDGGAGANLGPFTPLNAILEVTPPTQGKLATIKNGGLVLDDAVETSIAGVEDPGEFEIDQTYSQADYLRNRLLKESCKPPYGLPFRNFMFRWSDGLVIVTPGIVVSAAHEKLTNNKDQTMKMMVRQATADIVAPSPPTITALSVVTGLKAGGALIVITGTGFRGCNQVHFGNVPATFAVISPTQINAIVPASPQGGQVPVTLAAAGGTSNPESFNYH